MIRKRQRQRKGRALALSFTLVLSACAGQPVRIAGETGLVEADQAMLMPAPGAFAITGVAQKRFNNALQQEIFLSTDSRVPGQNVVQVRLFGTKSPTRYGDDTLAFTSLTESRINSELRGTLPGIAMVPSPFVTQNDYGPFGYAVGRPAADELCLYAWQQLRSPDGQSAIGTGAIQIRVRLCDRGATEEKLLAFMYGFTITAAVDAPGWNPYGTPAPVRQRLGKSGDPTYPRDMATVLPAPPPAPAAAPARTAQPAVPISAPQGPQVVVPSPAGGAAAASPVPAPAAPARSTTSAAPVANAGTVVPSPACLGGGRPPEGACP
ncbi:cellulose biosynthesis protein BcsN [Rhizobiaceae bacterium BDR2-2]|uniref:Cellulose biosynthesis protein BcsN n=1 Tax=Ectorhizobium quercum TaxID=2965071 RepID=A0AAE3MZ35_9HYPH|nr:cellulose biosynthesis protein BcsN [Ectorhizobium quercum]MCX8997923.1 cellulose biosynthesis protein BcsN [Ectorhizobium quercum]